MIPLYCIAFLTIVGYIAWTDHQLDAEMAQEVA